MPAAIPPQGCLLQFRNCSVLRNHKIYTDDLWVRDGKIIDPEKTFFDEQKAADIQIDCNNSIIAPGFIDVQINGENVIFQPSVGVNNSITGNTNSLLLKFNNRKKKRKEDA